MSMIKIQDITKKYGEKTILNKFSLEIEQGEFISIMGESGSGKSTLLNIVGLLEKFDSGTLTIDDKTNFSPGSSKANKLLRESISYLFQNFALIDEESVESNLDLALRYIKSNAKEKKQKIEDTLDYVGLKGFSKRKIFELSGGEQQRVAVARIMLKPSKIILADEPTGSLDEKNRDLILDLLVNLNKQGKTIVVVTHDKVVARRSNRIIYLK